MSFGKLVAKESATAVAETMAKYSTEQQVHLMAMKPEVNVKVETTAESKPSMSAAERVQMEEKYKVRRPPAARCCRDGRALPRRLRPPRSRCRIIPHTLNCITICRRIIRPH